MKKLLFILGLLISMVSVGQIQQPNYFPNNQPFGSPTTRTTFYGAVYPVVGFIYPEYADTIAANFNPFIKLQPGAAIRIGDSIYLRNDNATGWINTMRAASGSASGTLLTVGVTMPSAFTVSGSPLTGTGGTIAITGSGTTAQYIRGNGTLATFPTIPAQFNPIAGSNVTITGTYPNLTFSSTGGTVTNVSSGNLGTLFTVGITNPTTTPTFAFTGTNISQYQVLGRSASGTGAYSFLSLDTNFIANFSTMVRPLISLTTTGSSGAATYNSNTGVLNIPQYSGGTTYTIGTLNSQTKSANGAVISGSSLVMQTADYTHPGLLTAALFDSLQRSSYVDVVTGPSGFYKSAFIKNDSTLVLPSWKFTVNGGSPIVPTFTGDSSIWYNLLVSGTGIGSGFGIDSLLIGGTPAAVPYVGTSSLFQQSPTDFFYDSTNAILEVTGGFRGSSSSGDVKIYNGDNNVAFRGVRFYAGTANLYGQFFQVGNSNDNVYFTAQSGSQINRLIFNADSVQVSSNGYITNPNPSGRFGIVNSAGTTVFNLLNSGETQLEAGLRLKDISAPSTPTSGYGIAYTRADSLRFKNDAGTEFTLGVGASATAPGNYGNLILNRNNVYSAAGSDSVSFNSAVFGIKGGLTISSTPSGANTDSVLTWNPTTKVVNRKVGVIINTAGRADGDYLQWVAADNEYISVPAPSSTAQPFGSSRWQTGITTNSPSAGDSIVINTGWIDKRIFVYREGLRIDSNATDGYTFDRSTGILTVHPPWYALERMQVDAYDTTNVYAIALEPIAQPAVDLNFNNNRSNLTQVGTVFTPTANLGGFDAVGQDVLILPAGVSGGAYSQIVTSGDNTWMMYFSTSASFVSYADATSCGFYLNGSYGLQPNNGGTLTSSVYTASVGDYIRIYRDIGAGNIRLQTSTDAVTWTDRNTLSFYSAADLHISITIYSAGGSGPKVSNPKGQGVL